jgi:hypothetical protein
MNKGDSNMELAIEINKIDWWFWAIILAFILIALFGWIPAYYIVMVISGIQVLYFAQRDGSWAFTTQVRLLYFAVTLPALWTLIRFPWFILLLLGTAMVTFTGRCVLALILKKMPWNKGLPEGASCELKPPS